MKIGFSSFVLEKGRSGVASYILGLLSGLNEEDTTNRYDILVNREDAHLLPDMGPSFSKVVYPDFFRNPLINILWHNLRLPWKGYDLVHVPTIRRVLSIKPKKLVATVHDLAPLVIRNKYGVLRDRYHQFLRKA